MERYWFVLLAMSSSLVLGCAGSPYQIARMNALEIETVSDKNLCGAYDQRNPSSLVIQEVKKRNLDCIQVLRQANIPVRYISSSQSQIAAPTGDCSGIELMGIYASEDVVGLKHYAAKIRNRSNITKLVIVSFYPRSSPSIRRARSTTREIKGAREGAEVKAGDIASIQLDFSDHPPKDVRIVSCE